MKRTFTTTPEENPTLDMSSLVDVSFLLLIYFIVSSTLEPKESDIGMTVPGGISKGQSEIDSMTVEVAANGHIKVNHEVLDSDVNNRELPGLFDRLKTYVESARVMNCEPIVIVEADDASNGQRFVDVLNAMAHPEVKIKHITIAGFAD